MGVTAISIKGLSFRRKDHVHDILQAITLQVAAGEVCCLLGPNGAGKTTLLRCALGLATGWTGEAFLGGYDIREISRRSIARLVAYVPQSSETAFAFNVLHMVLMGRTVHFNGFGEPSALDRKHAGEALERAGIVHLRDRRFNEISGGERQLVLLARALAQNTPVVVMDEPTANLDLGNQARVLSVIRELAHSRKAVLMTSHLPDQAFILGCSVALIDQGQIFSRGLATDICSEETMSRLYDTSLHKLVHPTRSTLASFIPDVR